MAGIFLSYRRDDAAGYAGRLSDRLCSHFGTEDVFIDIDTIQPGESFPRVLEQKLEACEAMIVLIGNRWLDVTDDKGRSRLKSRNDFVRMEIAAALNRNILVFPVLVEGAVMPRERDLPQALRGLVQRQSIEIAHERFHQDVDRLIGMLERAVLAVQARQRRTLSGHTENVLDIAVSADGRRAVSGSADKTMKTWDLDTGVELSSQVHPDTIRAVAISPDGQWAVSAWGKAAKVWDIGTGRRVCTLSAYDEKNGFHRRHRDIVGHSERVEHVSVTADGQGAVTASYRDVKVWHLLPNPKVLRTVEPLGWIQAISADGAVAASKVFHAKNAAESHERHVFVWDLSTGRRRDTLEGHSGEVKAISITQDGSRAISSSYDETLRVWDLDLGDELCALRDHPAEMTAFALAPHGNYAVLALADNTIRVWDLETVREVRRLKGVAAGILRVANVARGLRIVSACGKTVDVWDVALSVTPTAEGKT